MRQLSVTAADKFINGSTFSQGNTVVSNDKGYKTMTLHGTVIARKRGRNEAIEITLAGHVTKLTKERLNGLLYCYTYGIPDLRVVTYKGNPYIEYLYQDKLVRRYEFNGWINLSDLNAKILLDNRNAKRIETAI